MILLDYKDRRPIYEQVVEKLQDLMICGAGATRLYLLRKGAGKLRIGYEFHQGFKGERAAERAGRLAR